MDAALDFELDIVTQRVNSLRNARVPDDVIAGLPSGVRLAELQMFARGDSVEEKREALRAEFNSVATVVSLHRSAGLSDEAIASTESAKRLAALRKQLAS